MIGVQTPASDGTLYANCIPHQHEWEGKSAEENLGGLDVKAYQGQKSTFLTRISDLKNLPLPQSEDQALDSSFETASLTEIISVQPHYGQGRCSQLFPGGASSNNSMVSPSSDSSPVPSPAAEGKVKPIPRHKRPSHQRAEVKRRKTIKDRLAELADMIGTSESKKVSEIEILTKAAGITRNLMGQKSEMNLEMEQLRSQKQALNAELAEMQKGLPPMGFVKETNPVTMNQLYKAAKEKKNCEKFILVRRALDSLFERFKEATADVKSMPELEEAALTWASEAHLAQLRSIAPESCMDLMRVKPTILEEAVVVSSTPFQAKFSSDSAGADSTTPTTELDMAPAGLEGVIDVTSITSMATEVTGATFFPMAAPLSDPATDVEKLVKAEQDPFLQPKDDMLPFFDGDGLDFLFDYNIDNPCSFSLNPDAALGEQWS